jgi:hypothetical protein
MAAGMDLAEEFGELVNETPGGLGEPHNGANCHATRPSSVAA